MHEVDLVPAAYREQIQLRSRALLIATVAAILMAFMLVARVALAVGIQSAQREFDARRVLETQAISQQIEIDRLSARYSFLSNRNRLLAGLQGGLSVSELFASVDRALDGRVWFREWTFRRAGEWVDAPAESVHAGYIFVVPDDAEEGTEKAWRFDTHMEIDAFAYTHSDLASFVSRLIDQPLVKEARVLSTRSERGEGGETIRFRLAVVVANGPTR